MTATWIEQDWRVKAACAETLNPEAWSLPKPATPEVEEMRDNNRAAIRVCLRCPVRRACARYALTTDPWPFGVIYAGIPLRREPGGQPNARSLRLLQAVADGAA